MGGSTAISFVIYSAVQPAHCIRFFFHDPSIPPNPPPRCQQGGTGRVLRSGSIYLIFFIHTHHHITQRYPRIHHTGVTLMNIPSHSIMIYTHLDGKERGSGGDSAFYAIAGTELAFGGVYFEARGGDNAARYCLCRISWGLIFVLFLLCF